MLCHVWFGLIYCIFCLHVTCCTITEVEGRKKGDREAVESGSEAEDVKGKVTPSK